MYEPAVQRAFLVLTTSWNGEYSHPCVIYRFYRQQQDIFYVVPSVNIFSSVIVHFNGVAREYFWIWIVDGNEGVNCDAAVVDMAKLAMVSFKEHQTSVPATGVLLQWSFFLP